MRAHVLTRYGKNNQVIALRDVPDARALGEITQLGDSSGLKVNVGSTFAFEELGPALDLIPQDRAKGRVVLRVPSNRVEQAQVADDSGA